MNSLSLLELNSLVRRVIEQSMGREYWVVAELAECRESRGHCYMELVEKDDRTNTPVARASAKCWRNTWMLVQPHFMHATGQQLRAGMKVRLRVYAQFHEAYGFSWIVTDIDPAFTLGDMARRRQQIVRQLKEEGVFDLQRELRLPLFCQRIAVISAEGAAGYGDFVKELCNNRYGYHFDVRLFPAVMQGEQVEQSIIAALNAIYADTSAETEAGTFDCVVIIRGGGSTSDLSGFDTLPLAENVAQFPIPIITGIGHDRDESVLDMVSHLQVKTPTAAAAFLVSHLRQVDDRLAECEERLLRHVQATIEVERLRLARLSDRIPTLFTLQSTRQRARLDQLSGRLSAAVAQRLEREHSRFPVLWSRLSASAERRMLSERHRLDMTAQRAAALDPALLLRRGYSITLCQGRLVRSADELKAGDEIVTRLGHGTVRSTVKGTAAEKPTAPQQQPDDSEPTNNPNPTTA